MSRCYVGNLPRDVMAEDLAAKFERVGKVLEVSVKKTVSDESYAFVHFADKLSAKEAVRELDNTELSGKYLRVEMPFEKKRFDDDYYRGREYSRESGYGSYRPRGGRYEMMPSRRSSGDADTGSRSTYKENRGPARYSIYVTGLPPSGSWQDLKDYFREAGECLYADVGPRGSGVVEYATLEDAKHAMRVCRGLTFTSHQGESAKIRLQLGDVNRPMRSEPYPTSRRQPPSGPSARPRRPSLPPQRSPSPSPPPQNQPSDLREDPMEDS